MFGDDPTFNPAANRAAPAPVVPPTVIASPNQLRVDPADVPFWTPTWTDTARSLGWRWLLLAPLLAIPIFMVWYIVTSSIRNWGPFLAPGLKLAVLAIGVIAGAAGTFMRKAVRARPEPFCIHCGYDLSGLPDDYTCPECGRHYLFSVIDEYRRDPHWFKQRWLAQHQLPPAAARFEAGPYRPDLQAGDGT